MSLYAEVLGEPWMTLPTAVRRIHDVGRARGTFDVQRGAGLAARLVGWLFRLPAAGRGVPVVLEVAEKAGEQTWTRVFGGAPLLSRQRRVGTGIVESLGPVECELAARGEDGALMMWSTGAGLRVGTLRCPLPSFLAPQIEAVASSDGEAARVDVRIGVAGLLLVRYTGRVEPVAP